VMLHWLVWDVAVPIMAVLLSLACIFYICQKIYRWWCPYSAEELHQQALLTLQPTIRSGQRNTKEAKRAEKQAEGLWQKALDRDPDNTSAWVSLSALYVYRKEEPKKALDLLKSYKQNSFRQPKSKVTVMDNPQEPLVERELNEELKAIEEDAEALQQGHKSMVQSDLAENEHLTFLAALARNNKNA